MSSPVLELAEISAIEARARQIEGEVASIAGVVNAANGVLVLRTAEMLEEPRLGLSGLRSAAQWVAWKLGISPAHAADVERVAKRVTELPCTVAALCAGRLSLDQAVEVAKHVPASYEESACEVAQGMTVSQLRRSLPHYGYEVPRPEGSAPPERQVSMGSNGKVWKGRFDLPLDEGAVLEHAIRTQTDLLRDEARASTPEGEDPPPIDLADGLVSVAETALRAEEAARPGSDRFLVNVHLDASAGESDPLSLTFHGGGGALMPRRVRRLLSCDPRLRSILYDNGVAIGAGRTTREIRGALRKAVLHRDGHQCMAPGCTARHNLQIHHIVHWEDGGWTETWNLVTLCARHHRLHHDGLLAIWGNPDLPPDAPGTLGFADERGRPMLRVGRPEVPRHDLPIVEAAEEAGLPAPTYKPPYNERLDPRDFFLYERVAPEVEPEVGASDERGP